MPPHRPTTDTRQLDLFYAFVGDVPLRDERESMSLPLVSLSKRKRIRPIEWKSGDGKRWCRVLGTQQHGIATIYDLDEIAPLAMVTDAELATFDAADASDPEGATAVCNTGGGEWCTPWRR